MAYGDKYVIPFKDDDLNWWRLVISKDDYSGITYDNIVMGSNPIQIEWQANNDYFKPIVGSSCKIRLFVKSEYGALEWQDDNVGNWEDQSYYTWDADAISFMNPDYDRQWKIKVEYAIDSGTTTSTTSNKLVDSGGGFTGLVSVGDAVLNTTDTTYAYVTAVDSNSTLTLDSDIFTSGENYRIFTKYWIGFVVQDQYTRPMKVFPYTISFYAADLVSTIKGFNYELTTEQPTAFEALRECLRQINLEDPSGTSNNSLDFGYKFLCRIKPTGESNGNPFAQTKIMSVDAFKDENGNAIDCKTILESLLMMFNCRIFQHKGQWTIISLDSLALSTFSGSGKNFITYDKNGGSESTYSIADPVKLINSTEDADTLQPMKNDLTKIIRRPCVRNKTLVRIKDLYKNEFNNGGFELVGSQGEGAAPAWGYIPTNWTITNAAITYAVPTNALDTSGGSPIQYGTSPYGGTYSFLAIGSSSSVGSVAFTNAGGVGTFNPIGSPLKFKFAAQAQDPDNSGLLAYTIRWRLKCGSVYWDAANNRWTSVSTVNSTLGALQGQWIVYEFDLVQPQTGTITVDFYSAYESVYNNSDFRIYYDEVICKLADRNEFYTTTTIVSKATIKDNSGVIKAAKNRFGQIGNDAYTNCLVTTGGVAISSFTDFDLSGTWNLETLINTKRLNDLAVNNDRFDGTFRKIKSSNGFLEPVDMLTLPKLNFTTVQSINNRLAIDKLKIDIKANRYKLLTHTPTQSNLTTSSDISDNRSFYEFEPED